MGHVLAQRYLHPKCYRSQFLELSSWLKRYNDHKDLEYFILITFVINLWPLLPSGNFFNNWLSFIIFFPLGFYIYTKNLKYGNK